MSRQLNEEETVLCRLLSAALHAKPCRMQEVKNADWEKVLGLADGHRVLPLLYDVLSEASVLTPEQQKLLDHKSRRTVRQSYRLLFLSRSVIELLKENGVDAVLLKGSGTAGLYPVPELRKSGDIDLLLCGEAKTERAAEILCAHGFRRAEKQSAHHHLVLFSPDGIGVELHKMLAEPFDNGQINARLAELIPEYLRHLETKEVMGVKFQLPQASWHAFYLLVHMLQHFLRAGFGLKLLCDWVVFWEKEYSREEQQTFLELVQKTGIRGFAEMVTGVCVRYLGLSAERVRFLVGDAAGKRSGHFGDGDAQELLLDILEAEEFGRSDAKRMVAMRGNSLPDYLREFHHQTLLTYPSAQKYKILLPAFWTAALLGFLYRNRKLRGVSGWAVLRKAGVRSRLAGRMQLFRSGKSDAKRLRGSRRK